MESRKTAIIVMGFRLALLGALIGLAGACGTTKAPLLDGSFGPDACVDAGGSCVVGPPSNCHGTILDAYDCNPDRNPGGAVCCVTPSCPSFCSAPQVCAYGVDHPYCCSPPGGSCSQDDCCAGCSDAGVCGCLDIASRVGCRNDADCCHGHCGSGVGTIQSCVCNDTDAVCQSAADCCNGACGGPVDGGGSGRCLP
jgi:hypothetical protein